MEWLRRVRMLLFRRRWRRELEEEMRLHRDLMEERRGDDRRFGNELRLRERAGDAWDWTWLESLGQDLRLGLRQLRRTPLATALALLSLTLGLGATFALLALSDAILVRPLPVAHPEQLVQLTATYNGAPYPNFSLPFFDRLRARPSAALDSWMAWSSRGFRQGSRWLPGAWVAGSYFQGLGIAPERGRMLEAGDDRPQCAARAVISDAFWHSQFGGAEAAVGSALDFSGKAFTIVGVMPPSFPGTEVGTRFDVVAAACAYTGGHVFDPGMTWLSVFARLRPGHSLAGAQAWLDAATASAGPEAPHPSLVSASRGTSHLRQRYGRALTLLLGIAGIVLLVACANLAGLMMARGEARQRELTVRAALGASRARLIRAGLAEAALLAVGGAGLGLAFAAWSCRALTRFFSSSTASVVLSLSPDASMLTAGIILVAATALLIGMVPAWKASRPEMGLLRLRRHRLAIAQIAGSLVLVATALLFVASLARLTGPDKGFDANHVLVLSTHDPVAHPLHMLSDLQTMPGAVSVGGSAEIPMQGSSWGSWLRFRQMRDGGVRRSSVYRNDVLPGYFATLRTPLLRGRDFAPFDSASAPPVAVVNASLARMLAPNGEALGAMVQDTDYNGKPSGRPAQVIGIVADAKYDRLDATAPPTVYFASAQDTATQVVHWEVRTPLSAETLVRELPKSLGAVDLHSLQDYMDSSIRPQRLLAFLAEMFGGLALLIAAIGLYAVLSCQAVRRRREFGVRIALGATPAAVGALVAREAAGVLVPGLVTGMAGEMLLTHALSGPLGGLLYEIPATSASALAAAAGLLAMIALLAAWWPARRAARADPMAALREE